MGARQRLELPASRRLLGSWLAFLTFAVALTLLVELDALPDEAPVIREVQTWPGLGEGVSNAVRSLTSTPFVLVLGLLMAAAHRLQGESRQAMVLILLLVALLALQSGLKELVDRPRPSDASGNISVRAAQTSPSFPAGHVMGPTVVYGWALVMLRRELSKGGASLSEVRSGVLRTLGALWAAGAAALVLLTGIVNIYLGVHWPSDILGGYLWGVVLLLAAMIALVRLSKN